MTKEDILTYFDDINFVYNDCMKLHTLSNMLDELEQEPKTGHWINAKVGKLFPNNDYKCSECGNILDFNGVYYGRGDANYCPNCGAKMESEENNVKL